MLVLLGALWVIFVLAVVIALVVTWIWFVVHVVTDARKNDFFVLPWLVLTICSGPWGLLVYSVYKIAAKGK
ncbi:hypothetical protein NO2_1314 [Candidatus Termititenax persephonae]|uniref:Cardiolipin synthase N-terminal domain-containing protein n=1 Tax=Candidatus Termititenax persephonae TaxID=2218525 RepID=A0A388TI25_9BACT|nr:hypothetical protein NO2_1314 [Candidatus Termititenax persephonae]